MSAELRTVMFDAPDRVIRLVTCKNSVSKRLTASLQECEVRTTPDGGRLERMSFDIGGRGGWDTCMRLGENEGRATAKNIAALHAFAMPIARQKVAERLAMLGLSLPVSAKEGS